MAKFKDSLEYHSSGRKGKIEVVSTKPCQTAEDLSLAYSPGVAEPGYCSQGLGRWHDLGGWNMIFSVVILTTNIRKQSHGSS